MVKTKTRPRGSAAIPVAKRNWIRAPYKGTIPGLGVTRGQLYDWADKGLIVTSVLRAPGKTKGTRLFDENSIRLYLESRIAA